MEATDLERVIRSGGHPCRIQGDEILVQRCVFCGNERWNLQVSVSAGVFHCWVCGKGGAARTFISEYCGQQLDIPVEWDKKTSRRVPHIPVEDWDFIGPPAEENALAMKYLKGRGLNEIDCSLYGLRSGVEGWLGRIVFPFVGYFSGQMFGVQGRTFNGSLPKYLAQWSHSQYELAGFRSSSTVHVLVEGLFDGVAIHRAGFNAAMLLGTTSEDSLLYGWGASVPVEHDVIVMLDGAAKDRATTLLYKLYGVRDRVRVVDLPEAWDPGMVDPVVIRALINQRRSAYQ